MSEIIYVLSGSDFDPKLGADSDLGSDHSSSASDIQATRFWSYLEGRESDEDNDTMNDSALDRRDDSIWRS